MKNRVSNDVKRFFWLELTRLLIQNSYPKTFEIKSPEEILEIREVKKEMQQEHLEKHVKEAVRLQKQTPEIRLDESTFRSEFVKKLQQPEKQKIRILKVPKTNLPPHLQYLKPIPRNEEIYLGKLNFLLQDPVIRDIECDGPDREIIVSGTMGTKKVRMVLTKEEIDEIIKKFSEISKIPADEGLFKIVAGKLMFTAIISRIASSRFLIRKMIYTPWV